MIVIWWVRPARNRRAGVVRYGPRPIALPLSFPGQYAAAVAMVDQPVPCRFRRQKIPRGMDSGAAGWQRDRSLDMPDACTFAQRPHTARHPGVSIDRDHLPQDK